MHIDSLIVVFEGEIDKKPALVQLISYYQTGNKPPPEIMLTQIISSQGVGIS